MKLVDLLDTAIKTGDMIYIDDQTLGIRYCKENGCFVWCNPGDGKFEKSTMYKSGYQNVVLSDNLLKENNWKLIPMPRKRDYKVGDRILIPELTKVIFDCNEVQTYKHTCKNIVGEIIGSNISEDDGCEYFIIDLSDGFGTIILGQYALRKYYRLVLDENS